MSKANSTIGPREAICQFMGWEFSESSEYRYHPSRTGATAVYSGGSGYVFCLPVGRTVPKAIREYFPESESTISKATGVTADYLATCGKQVWLIEPK